MTYLDRQARVRGSCARDLPVVTVVGQSERLVVDQCSGLQIEQSQFEHFTLIHSLSPSLRRKCLIGY